MIFPGATQNDLQGLTALLDVISDVSKSKKRLEELVQASLRAQEDERAAMDSEVQAQHTIDIAQSITDEQKKRESLLNKKEEKLNDDKATLTEDSKALKTSRKEFEADVEARTQELKTRIEVFETHVGSVSALLAERERRLVEKEEEANRVFSEYSTKVKALKGLVG